MVQTPALRIRPHKFMTVEQLNIYAKRTYRPNAIFLQTYYYYCFFLVFPFLALRRYYRSFLLILFLLLPGENQSNKDPVRLLLRHDVVGSGTGVASYFYVFFFFLYISAIIISSSDEKKNEKKK